MSYLEYDNNTIYDEQKATFNLIFDTIDLDKFVFVGGVADYLNLRNYFEMPVHDLDIVYQKEEALTKIRELIHFERYTCNFYRFDDMQVSVAEHFTNGKRVHIDFFKRHFLHGSIVTSELLGQQVQHSSFEAMKNFHNEHIPKLTSVAMGKNYEWRRLYKHSKKASLYNLVSYREEKQLKQAVHE